MNIEQIIGKLRTDAEFAAKYAALKDVDAILEQAKKDGFDVTREDVETAMREMPQKTGELTEGELALISGGDSANKGGSEMGECWFTPVEGWKKDENGDTWKKCKAQCFSFGKQCSCHGWSSCVNFWHKVYSGDEYLYPKVWDNHADKHPPTYNT